MDLAALLEQSYRNQQRGVHTALPGVIRAYDAAQQRASVQPALSRNLSTGAVEALPVLEDVPVIWPRSGGAHMTFPVKEGDGCLLIFTERSLDEWKARGGAGEAPLDPRQHALSDAVALMGFVHFGGGGGPGDAIEIHLGSCTITIGEGSVTVDAPSVTVNANSVEVNAPESQFNGNVAISGNLGVVGDMNSRGPLNITGPSVSHNGKNIGANHTHSGVQTGGGSTGAPN
ncbi:MAG: phage baseplate protein [Rhodovulum sulfidophilum]|uniref:Phage baseplate protein n=1 Tax=Rhodovulum sulfidophilum TaxID=35806 RepID=A0A2W5N8H5_RHOSU|nr:MAG: phage baseplate protein [Rhodovulum sulfidophilum]